MLWSSATATLTFSDFSAVALTGWMQAFTTLLMLIVVWMTFVGLLMRFVWTPALSDTALPFIVGLLQFAVIEASMPDRFGFWLIGIGMLSLVMSFLTQRYFKRARSNPQNAEFFQQVSPATWRDFLPSIIGSTYAIGIGVALLFVSIAAWAANLLILPIIAGLAYHIFDQNRYWVLSIPHARNSARNGSETTEEPSS